MWFEILPSYVIVSLGIMIPAEFAAKYLHLFANGNKFGRDATGADMRQTMLRDMQHHNNVYKFVGLESLKSEGSEKS
ncbi:hypothetical protein M8J75_014705 [Diaphorina citri]|nr:hypothetical protein M8J75_014705 [Diaphorina citri]